MSVVIPLPDISYAGGLDLKSAIYERSSVRRFTSRQIALGAVADLLWSAQGHIRTGKRAVPSAGATYPLQMLLAVADNGVEGLSSGLYQYNHHYDVDRHSLQLLHDQSVMGEVAEACFGQTCVKEAMALIAVVSDNSRTAKRYGERAERYVAMEAGHVGQNVSLMALSLGLGAVMVGAFKDDEVARALRLQDGLRPYYVIPVGHPYSE
ncbi:MAG TPA: SagB/ThcOx family dehydrogenase [bacterium]|nr:SagB/ThcOx family dehydrogenase [bacterium]